MVAEVLCCGQKEPQGVLSGYQGGISNTNPGVKHHPRTRTILGYRQNNKYNGDHSHYLDLYVYERTAGESRDLLPPMDAKPLDKAVGGTLGHKLLSRIVYLP